MAITDQKPRKTYAVGATPQASFTVPFPFFSPGDLRVYVGGTLKALGADYSVSGGNGSTGTVTLSATVANTKVSLVRRIPIDRLSDFPAAGAFKVPSLNRELDRNTALIQQLDDDNARAIRPPEGEDMTGTLPAVEDRADRALGFDEDGNPRPSSVTLSAIEAATAGAIAAGKIIVDCPPVTSDGTLTSIDTGYQIASAAQVVLTVGGIEQRGNYTISGTVVGFPAVPAGVTAHVRIMGVSPDSPTGDVAYLPALPLAPVASGGTSPNSAAVDHKHPLPTPAAIGALATDGDASQTVVKGRTLDARAGDVVNVLDYAGATDTARFQAAYDACPAGGTVLVPAGSYSPIAALAGTKLVTWDVRADTAANLSLLALPGTVRSMHGTAQMVYQAKSAAGDYAVARVDRNANHSGGAPGSVATAQRVSTAVAANVTNFEWAFLSTLDNSATAGENVAIYGQAKKRAAGSTWAGCFELQDYTTDPAAGAVTVEYDLMANGSDISDNRVILDCVVGKRDASGSRPRVAYGLRFGPRAGDSANGYIGTAIRLNGEVTKGLSAAGTGTVLIEDAGSRARGIDLSSATYSGAALRFARDQTIALEGTSTLTIKMPGASDADLAFQQGGTAVAKINLLSDSSVTRVLVGGSCAIGIDLSSATTATAAIRLARSQKIALEATGTLTMQSLGSSDSVVRWSSGAAELVGLNLDPAAPGYRVNGDPVVRARKTGWATGTGTATRATFDTATVTLPQLAERVKALIDDLHATAGHGLIGV